ncbi:MAG: anion permease [Peptococcaceae bacterium]|nr:anion permease [Peptococcaceae bacterium]
MSQIATGTNQSVLLNKKILGLFLGPLFCFLIIAIPPIAGLSPIGQKALGGAIWVITWWMTETFHLSVTSLWALVIFSFLGVVKPLQGFTQLATNPVMMYLGAAIILGAWQESGYIKRLALRALASKWVGDSTWRVVVAFGLVCALISTVVANIAVTILFLALALAMMEGINGKPGSVFGRSLVIYSGTASMFGGIATPLGAAGNLIAIGVIANSAKYNVEFWQWTVLGTPIALLLIISMLVITRYLMPLPKEEVKLPVVREYLDKQIAELGPMSRYEKISAAVFFIALAAMLCGGPVTKAMGWKFTNTLMDGAFICFVMSCILFIIPFKKEGPTFAMDWQKAAKAVDWGIVIYVMGAGVLSQALTSTGVTKWAAQMIQPILAPMSGLLVFYMFILICLCMTQLLNNVAVVAVAVPIIATLAPMNGIDPVLACVIGGMVCNIGFLFPFSSVTVSVAMLGNKGYASVGDFFKLGLPLLVAGSLVAFVVGLVLGPLVFAR